MLGLIPIDWRTALVVAAVPVALAALVWQFSRWCGRSARAALRWAAATLLVAGVLQSFLFPAIARVERIYYHGQDHFYWAGRMWAEDEATRHDAVTVLTHMLRSSRSTMRIWLMQRLADRGAEAQPAVAALTDLAEDTSEDPMLREKARDTIARITGVAADGEPVR